jgi:hypothetical protein
MPAIIQAFWKGPRLYRLQRLSIASFLDHGHAVRLYAYETPAGLPRGVELCDASDILPYDSKLRAKSGFGSDSPATFADRFRTQLLHDHGGWWVDLDVVCLRPFPASPPALLAGSWEIPEGNCMNINVLRFPAGHPVLAEALRLWTLVDREAIRYTEGIEILRVSLRHLGQESLVVSHRWFNPVSWRHTQYLVDPTEPWWHHRSLRRSLGLLEQVGRIGPDCYAVHFWNETWGNLNLDREDLPRPGSLYAQLWAKHACLADSGL